MKRLLKILAWVLGILIILVVAAVLILPLVFDPNDYRDEINALVEKQTGRELVIEGDLSLSVFPWLGVEIGKTRLANAEGFGPEPFARFEAAKVQVKVLPLLKREVEVDTVTLSGLRLNLARNAAGTSNWDDLIKAPAEPAAEQPAPTEPGTSPQEMLAALAIGGVHISDAHISWDDRQADQHAEIRNFNLRSGVLDLRSPFPLSIETDFSAANPDAQGRLEFKGNIGLNLDAQQYRVEGLDLALDLKSPLVPGGLLDARLAGDLGADLKQQTANVQGLRLSALGTRIGANIKAAQILAQPDASGSLSLRIDDTAPLARVLADLGIALPLELKSLQGTDLSSGFSASLGRGTAEVSELKLDTLGITLRLAAKAREVLAQPAAEGTLAIAVNDASALARALGPLLPLEAQALAGGRLDTRFAADLARGTAAVPELKLSAMGLSLDASAEARDILGQPAAEGRVVLDVKDGAKLLSPFAASLPPTLAPASLSGSHLETGYALDLASQQLSLDGFKLSALGLAAGVELSGKKIIDAPNFTGRLAVQEFVPRDLLAKLGIALPDMADESTLTKAALSLRFDAGLDHAAVEELLVRVDDSTLKGRASARNFQAPVIRYDLNLDRINLDRYLPPPSEQPEAATPASAAAAGALQLPLELLRSLDVDGSVRVGQLQAANLKSRQILATLKAQNGLFRLNPVGAQLYEGSYAGDLRFDVRGDVPAMAMDEKLQGVQVGPLLLDFLGKDYVSGKAELAAKLSANGLEPMAIRKSLTGQASFSFLDGAVNGINLGHLLRTAQAKIEGKPVPAEEVRKTDFAQLTGSIDLQNGLATNRDLSAKTPLFRVTGAGQVDLVKETIDYTVNAAVVSSLEGQGGKELQNLAGLTIPVHIGGTFSAPSFDVPLQKVLEERAKQALEAEKQKAQQRLEAEKQKAQQQLEAERKKKEAELKKKLEDEQKKLQKDLEKKLQNMLKF